jgi:4-carboxymuconolactone decarboxylase
MPWYCAARELYLEENMKMPRSLRAILLAGIAATLLAGTGHAQSAAAGTGSAGASAGAALPADIDPVSGNRLPAPTRDGLSDEDAKIFDALTHGQQASVRLYSPRLAQSLGTAQNYLKSGTGFGDRLTEIAVLVTTREVNSQFLWTIWEEHGRDPKDSRHLEPEIIDAIKYARPVAGLGEKEALIITFGRELLGDKKVSPETFAHAVRVFGRRGTVDLVELLAQWSATCVELAAFDQQLPPGQKPLLPAR